MIFNAAKILWIVKLTTCVMVYSNAFLFHQSSTFGCMNIVIPKDGTIRRISSNFLSSSSLITSNTTESTLKNDDTTTIPSASSNPTLSSSTKRKNNKNGSNTIISPETLTASSFPQDAFLPKEFFKYELVYQSKKSMARVGRIHTPHGIIDTPGFVAVATNGVLKGLDMRHADAAGQQLVFCNSYHLLLQPGPEIIQGAGGLHKFMNRPNGPLITDSGGFQVFSLAYGSVQESLENEGELKRININRNNRDPNGNKSSPVKVTEDGVLFRSYRDGKYIMLTPESTVQAQKAYGADIIIPLDQLPPYHIDRKLLEESVERSHRWEARSLMEHVKNIQNQAMYCVIHGGVDVELRTKSIDYLTSLCFDGYAIGGSLGKNADELGNLLQWMMPLFNKGDRIDKPRHLLGIADEKGVDHAVVNGIDTMDSCYPTRISRHGTLLSRKGKVHIKSGSHARSYGIPIDEECSCTTCTHYDRSYLWHLFKASEPLFIQLAAVHNVHYMNELMRKYRHDILDGKV